LSRIKPDLLLLAEVSARDPYYATHGFDAAYDWTDKLGEWAWHDAFADEERTANRLRAAIDQTHARRHPSALVFRFLNNNDTGSRFITRYGAGTTRVAAAILLSLPGLPGVYAGDEVGAAFEPYAADTGIAWDDVRRLRSWYSRLIALRARHPVLRSQDLQFVNVAPADQVLAYVRSAAGECPVLVLLNFGSEPVEAMLPESATALQMTETIDLLDESTVLKPGDRVIPLASYGVRVLGAQ
jgi:glycosidase